MVLGKFSLAVLEAAKPPTPHALPDALLNGGLDS